MLARAAIAQTQGILADGCNMLLHEEMGHEGFLLIPVLVRRIQSRLKLYN